MNDWERIKKLGGAGILTRADITDLTGQRAKVLWLMLDGKWHSADAIREAAGGSEGLRRLRELRELPYATITREKSIGRMFFYRLDYAPGIQTELF